jgi:hypothetical protein
MGLNTLLAHRPKISIFQRFPTEIPIFFRNRKNLKILDIDEKKRQGSEALPFLGYEMDILTF